MNAYLLQTNKPNLNGRDIGKESREFGGHHLLASFLLRQDPLLVVFVRLEDHIDLVKLGLI